MISTYNLFLDFLGISTPKRTKTHYLPLSLFFFSQKKIFIAFFFLIAINFLHIFLIQENRVISKIIIFFII